MSATENNSTNVFSSFDYEDYGDLDAQGFVELQEAAQDEVLDSEQSAGSRLKALRQKSKLSLRALAAKLGEDVHFTTIAKLETGRMRLTEAWANRLASALDAHPAEMLAEEGSVGAARKIPVYDAEDITFADGTLSLPDMAGEILATRGSTKSFALRIEFRMHLPNVRGFVQIDPNLTAVEIGKTYLLWHDNDLIIAPFLDGPARFEPWISKEDAPDLLVGASHFTVLGQALEVHAKL